jgi:hypothetical protein
MGNARRAFVAALLFVTAIPMIGQRLPDQYERVLIPVLPIGDWSATLWIHNDGAESVDMFPLARNADSPSRGTLIPLLPPGLNPHGTLEYWTISGREEPYYIPVRPTHAGAVLYVERGKRENVRFQLRVANVQVPAIPERDFAATPITFMQIPVNPGQRYTLRVYALDGGDGNVEVSFRPLFFGLPVAPEIVQLRRPSAEALCAMPPCPWPDVPFTSLYGAMFFDTTRVPNWTYQITVAADPGVKIWAFISETDVTTRRIRLHTPN